MLILGQVSILLGVKSYNDEFSPNPSPLGIINIIIFFALLFISEIYYQVYLLKKPEPFPSPSDTMTLEAFNK